MSLSQMPQCRAIEILPKLTEIRDIGTTWTAAEKNVEN